MTPEPAISVRGLTKAFGDFTAVDGIDFDVPRGQVFGFLGPNGSGKTTTIRMLTGTLRAKSGEATVLGEDVLRHPERVQPRIGYMSQKFSLFEDMTVDENLRFYAGVYDLSPQKFASQREYVLRMADLVGREDELTRNLSVGWRQRLALGAATIHEPELLFLDEPTSGVDPVARRQFWDLLYDLASRGVTLFVTTHYMDEAAHCNRLAFIYRGRIIAEGSPTEIRTEHMEQRIFDVSVHEVDPALQWLETADGIDEAYLSGASLHAVVPADSSLSDEALTVRLGAQGFTQIAVAEVEPTIEDVFVNLVTRQR
ncbi:MAG TPA: ABC transporter ATP-binding protein [Propionicimonas sp.]|nr:ABC transporter ATP-binding protein [Propionicimonas sp.]HRA06768.1 ABC transporter ATP-binding protein [Propionicimonas sp.]